MKQLNKLFKPILLIGFLCTVSCTDLEVEATDSALVDTEGGNATTNVTELLASNYTDLGAFTDQAGIYSLYTHTSDEMIPPTRGTDWGDNGVWRTLHTHNWSSTHDFVLSAWNQLNQRLFKATRILASNPSPQQGAEAKFLRAFFMWHIMDLYGKVPFREANEGGDIDPRVLTRAEAFDFIIADLESALPNLPSRGPNAVNAQASKATANALLARLYLNKAVYMQPLESAVGPYTFASADMDKVIQHADAVIAEGYSLEADYFTNFTTNADNEVIFTSPEGSPDNRWRMTLHYDTRPDGWNGFATLSDFYAKFETNDNRRSAPSPVTGNNNGIKKGFLIGPQTLNNGAPVLNSRQGNIQLNFKPQVTILGAATDEGIRVIKYHQADQGKYILLRFADVYLMKAEAMFRKGNAAGALTMMNALRANRGASTLTSVTEANILDERGRELYWEGIRRTDQVRFGTFDDVWQEKTSTNSNRVIFPVPQQALDSNPNLVQNPGY